MYGMKTVTIHEAKTHFSRLINEALAGEEVIIARRNKPVIRLTPLPEALPERAAGGKRGLVEKIADDFDEPVVEFADYLS